jgi:hypothetical protein
MNMCHCDKSITVVNGKRYQRLNSAGKPEPNPEKGVGFVLVDKPDHRKPRKGA